jgi:hypothetical protein
VLRHHVFRVGVFGTAVAQISISNGLYSSVLSELAGRTDHGVIQHICDLSHQHRPKELGRPYGEAFAGETTWSVEGRRVSGRA